MMKAKEIPALLNKRAELTAEIQIAERRLASLRANLASIETTIATFAFSRTPAGRAQRINNAGAPRSAQVSRAILDVLRRAGEPLSEQEIAERIATDRGLPSADAELLKRVRIALSTRRDGLLENDCHNGAALWKLAI